MNHKVKVLPDGRPDVVIARDECFAVQKTVDGFVFGEMRSMTERERAEQVVLRASQGVDVPRQRFAWALTILLDLQSEPVPHAPVYYGQ